MSDPGISVDPAATALLIVDMQNDFCHPEGYYAGTGRDISALAAASAPIRELLGSARASGMSVVFTRLVYDAARGAMQERHAIRPRRWTASGKRLVPGTWGAEVLDALRPLADELVIDKHGYSAFAGTALEEALRARGVRTLLLTGVVTYACVLATAFAAFDRDFDVVLVSDAVGTWNPSLGTATLEISELLLGQALPRNLIRLKGAA